MGIEKGSRGQRVLYCILTLDVDTLMGAGQSCYGNQDSRSECYT